MMEYRRLGNTGLKVSSLCLGTMTLGQADETSFLHGLGCDEETAFQILDRAIASGINFLDTADVYGQDGMVEKLLGRWFESSKTRDRVVLATKCRFRISPDANGAGASRYHILRAVEGSLKRLKTDRIDLYQIHMQDIETPEEETLRALDDLVRQGKVRYIGASNYTAYRLVDSVWISRTKNLASFVSLQAHYNLVTREIERELVPACREHGMGILVWSPLAGGFLSGKYRNQEIPKGSRLSEGKMHYGHVENEKSLQVIEGLKTLGLELDVKPAQLALAWLLHKQNVSSVIFGARSLEQLETNLMAATLPLSAETIKRLDEISAIDLGYPYSFIKRVQKMW